MLIVYGTLAPGGSNHHILEGLTGRWRPGRISADYYSNGWRGYPGVVPTPSVAPHTLAWAFESEALAAHWPRLDEFEGPGYVRTRIQFAPEDGGQLEGWVYALRNPPPFPPDASGITA